MKAQDAPEEKFEWDFTVVALMLLALAFGAIVLMALWPTIGGM
jgi:hypothetical protein